jgi:hypothetical protein
LAKQERLLEEPTNRRAARVMGSSSSEADEWALEVLKRDM